jgi:type III restriction enzyme
MQIKSYQNEAIRDLTNETKKLLYQTNDNKMVVFQSPTGSGKTVMTANYIKSMASTKIEDVCFVWISIGKGDLHLQSKKKLEKIFRGFPKCSLVEEEFTGSRTVIEQNEVVVVNWEKLRDKDKKGEWKNILMRDGEKINFREVLENTRRFRHIILVVDEFHFGGLTERSKELYEIIKPNFILGMSATPDFIPSAKDLMEGTKGYVYVKPENVIKEGMIKREVRINDILGPGNTSQEKVLNAAYERRIYLKKLFEKENSKVNPLVLVQIPNADNGDRKLSEVIDFLKEKGITEENGKLAIWLSNEKSEHLQFISNNDNKIEYLIFKQAVDTGWDCPRAHILVKLRSTKSEVFEKQTVGRILRMPEQKHYDENALNIGYIYTDQEELLISEDIYNLGTLKNMTAFVKEEVKSVELTSYQKPNKSLPSLTIDFIDYFLDYMDKKVNIQTLMANGFVSVPKEISRKIVTNLTIDTVKFDEGEVSRELESHVEAILSHSDVAIMFYQLLLNHVGKFGKPSLSYIKEAVIEWFRHVIDTKNWDNEIVDIEKLFILNYEDHFKGILNNLLISYEKSLKDKQIQLVKTQEYFDEQYHLPSILYHNDQTEEELVGVKKYAYDRCFFRKDRSTPEQHFIDFIQEHLDNIDWWWKNGDSGKENFAIKYEFEGEINAFYPDFIIGFTNGTIGIFETKDEHDVDAKTKTKAKAEALYRYIQSENMKGKNALIGGIVIEQNAGRAGVWKINQYPVYQADNLSEWEVLKF